MYRYKKSTKDTSNYNESTKKKNRTGNVGRSKGKSLSQEWSGVFIVANQ